MRKFLILCAIIGAVLFVHIDWYPKLGVYGVSVGTNYSYCDIEFVVPDLDAGCETAQ